MRNKTLLFILLFPYLNHSYAQQDFRKAFIIKSNNDTIYGLIDYKSPSENSKHCFFRKNKTSKITEYKPDKLKAYSFYDSKYYVSKEYTINDSTALHFMEYLVNGIVDLYFLRFQGKDYFLLEKDNKLHQLTNEDIYVKVNKVTKKKSSNQYIGALKYLMQDADNLSDKIKNTEFTHSSLIKITRDYHDIICNNNEKCIIYYKKQRKLNDAVWTTKIGFSIESVWSKIKFSSVLQNYGTNSFSDPLPLSAEYFRVLNGNANFDDLTNTIVPGLFINLNRNNRSSIQLDIKYQILKFSEIEFTKLQFPISWQYNLLRYSKLSPYIKLGVGGNLFLNHKINDLFIEYEQVEEVTQDQEVLYGEPTIYSLKDSDLKNKLRLSFNIGSGISYQFPNNHSIKLEVIYMMSNLKLQGNNNEASRILSTINFHDFAIVANYSF